MKPVARMIAATAVALVLLPAVAQQPAGPDANGSPPAAAATPQEVDKQVAAMQEQMNKMHAQMARIQQTEDPKERQKLLQEHWETMQGAMAMMDGTSGGMMGAHMAMGGPMMWGKYQQLTPDQLKQRQYMMDRWMPMQQMMMNQMMQHQHWMMMQSQPPAPPKK